MAITASKPAINIREKLSELDFDKVPFQKMPAGSVLQVVSSRFTTGYNHNSTSFVDVGHSVTIAPKSATSTLYITLTSNLSISGCNGIIVSIREGSSVIVGGSAANGHIFLYSDTYTNNRHWNQSAETFTDSTGTIARTFKVSTKVSHGGPGTNSCKYQGDWTPCILTVTEVL